MAALTFLSPAATSSYLAAPSTVTPPTASPLRPSHEFASPASASQGNNAATALAAAAACGLCSLAAAGRRKAALRRGVPSSVKARPSIARRSFLDFDFLPWNLKTAVITGASSGLGLAAAKELVDSGEWMVIMACRDFAKAETVARENGFPDDRFKVIHCDLASNNSVRQFVKTFRALGRPVDALVCNAAVYFPNAHKTEIPGLMGGGGPRWSADGHEMSFAANYLGHFLLCNLLIPDMLLRQKKAYAVEKLMLKPARCVILGTVTATINDKEVGGMVPPLADLGSLQGIEHGMKKPITMINGGAFDGAKAYKDSKVCDVMLMRELHKRYHKSTGIVFTSLYPGCIAETGLFREHYPLFRSLFPTFHKTVTKAYVSEKEAGERLAKCVADEHYGKSGAYYSWGGEAGTGGFGGKEAFENTDKTYDTFVQLGAFRTMSSEEIGGEAGNDLNSSKLWDLSEELVGEKFEMSHADDEAAHELAKTNEEANTEDATREMAMA